MRMVTTYIHRANTNAKVLEEATRAVNVERTRDHKKVGLLSETHTRQRVKLAGKILRCADSDPRRYTTYRAGTGRVKKKVKLRTGRPRINWGDLTHVRIWEQIRAEIGEQDEIGDPRDEEQQNWIRDAATLGMF